MPKVHDTKEKAEARQHVHDEIRRVKRKYFNSIKKVNNSVHVCDDMNKLLEIKAAYSQIEAMYPEYNFNLDKYIPYVSELHFDIMRVNTKKVFVKRELKEGAFFPLDRIESYRATKEFLLEIKESYKACFTDVAEQLLFDSDLTTLIFKSHQIEGTTDIELGLLASTAAGVIIRYHGGYTSYATTRHPDTQEIMRFRANCIVAGVNSCTVVEKIPRKKRIDTSIEMNKPFFVLKRDTQYLSQVEAYAFEIGASEVPDEIEILL